MPTGPLAIVILNYQGSADTIACLTSLAPALERAAGAGHGPFLALVIDNGSDVEDVLTLTGFLKGAPWVAFQQNAENVGFARGVNQGIRWAYAQGAAYVLLLNNDTLCDPEAIRQLCEQAAPDSLLAPLILQQPARETIWSLGGHITWGAVPARLGHYGKPLSALAPEVLTQARLTTGFLSGCALLIPMGVLGRIGLFDETYFAYVEDVDFCLRAAKHGIGCQVAPRSRVYHKSGAATGGGYSVRGRYLMGFGTAICARTHATGWQRVKTHWLMRLSVVVARIRERGGPYSEAPLAKWRGYKDGLAAPIKKVPLLEERR